MITQFDGLTGKVTVREPNEKELAQQELDRIALEKEEMEKAAEAQAKAAQRQAILDRLGLTEEEAQLLLGGN